MDRIWTGGFQLPAMKVPILQVSDGRGDLTRHQEGMWGGGASLQDGAEAAAGLAEVGISVARTNASERTWESEWAIISEFDLDTPLVTHVTPVMTDGIRGDVRGVRGAVQEIELVPKTEVGEMHS